MADKNAATEEKIEDDLPPGDAPEDGAGEGDAGDGSASKELSADVGLDALKIQLDKERTLRFAAENRASVAERKAHSADRERQSGDLQVVMTAIEQVTSENAAAKRELSAAMRAGDFDRAAELQEIMAINGGKLVQLENGRAALEHRVRTAAKEPLPQEVPADPVEAVASQLSPRSAEWVRAHPDCVRDQRKYLRMIGAHNIAISDGLQADTDDYFAFIEEQMGLRKAPQRASGQQDDDDPSAQAAKPVVRRPAPPAAPPTRGSGNGGRSVRLTAEQREAAEISGLTEEEYARNLVKKRN